MENVIVTHGANGALSAFTSAFCNSGDQAVTFGPMFPCYTEHVEFAGATMKSVPLHYQDDRFTFDP